MSKAIKSSAIKIISLALTLSLIFSLTACTGKIDSVKSSDESSPVTEQTQGEVTEPESEPEPDGNYYEIEAASAFVGAWYDKYSARARMIISHIGGNYYDVNVWWANNASGEICWSLTGTYNEETEKMDYTGMEYELIFSDDSGSPTMDLIDENCEGSFFFNDDGNIKWSSREKCKFVEDGSDYSGSGFAKISSPEGYAYVFYEDEYTERKIVAALPSGVTVNVVEEGDEFTEINCGSIKGEVMNSQLAPLSLAYDKPAFTVMRASELENTGEEYGEDDVAIVPEKPMSEFKLLSLNYYGTGENGTPIFRAEEKDSADVLDSAYVAPLSFYGSIPNNGVSYVDSNGVFHAYSISLSGRDGSYEIDKIDLLS